MDEVLKRILAVENQAAELVQNAEQQAERIAAEARTEAQQLEATLLQQMTEDADRIIGEAVQQAEQEKADRLQEEQQRIRKEVDRLRAHQEPAIDRTVQRLAFPGDF